jgi:hypothetical protein
MTLNPNPSRRIQIKVGHILTGLTVTASIQADIGTNVASSHTRTQNPAVCVLTTL